MSEIRNLHPDPRCLRQRATWNGGATANGEKWRYELSADSSKGSVLAWKSLTNQFLAGKVLYALYQRGDIEYPWVAGPRDATMAGEIGPWEL